MKTRSRGGEPVGAGFAAATRKIVRPADRGDGRGIIAMPRIVRALQRNGLILNGAARFRQRAHLATEIRRGI